MNGKIFTTGTHHNCECPFCGNQNHDVTRDVEVPVLKVVTFSKPCFHCKETIWHEARLDIVVVAERTDPRIR